jgi:hypothetical protein
MFETLALVALLAFSGVFGVWVGYLVDVEGDRRRRGLYRLNLSDLGG